MVLGVRLTLSVLNELIHYVQKKGSNASPIAVKDGKGKVFVFSTHGCRTSLLTSIVRSTTIISFHFDEDDRTSCLER